MERTPLKGSYVLDSSVIIKWFCNEEYTSIALQIREAFRNGSLLIAIPDLTLYEISNALRYNKKLSSEEVIAAVQSIFDLKIEIIVPNRPLLKKAIELAFKHTITVYDAYFLSLAKELGYTLVTADEKSYVPIKNEVGVLLLKDLANIYDENPQRS